ncbi:MAG TPA: DUF1707 domain-containing protein [Solirubrobacteraceae bacterium]|jgi:hypothetical protein|nr:DUF1707 domain-containing protein [Solirubrobacteraceae bacterium]
MAGREAMRASDTDRDRVAERLREAASEGRLMIEELEQRVDRALRARTYGELEVLIADLPGPRLLSRTRRRRRRVPLVPALGLVVGVVLLAPLVLASIALMVQLALGVLVVWWIWAGVAWLFFGRVLHRRRAAYWHHAYWRRPVPGLGPRACQGQWHAQWDPRRRA